MSFINVSYLKLLHTLLFTQTLFTFQTALAVLFLCLTLATSSRRICHVLIGLNLKIKGELTEWEEK